MPNRFDFNIYAPANGTGPYNEGDEIQIGFMSSRWYRPSWNPNGSSNDSSLVLLSLKANYPPYNNVVTNFAIIVMSGVNESYTYQVPSVPQGSYKIHGVQFYDDESAGYNTDSYESTSGSFTINASLEPEIELDTPIGGTFDLNGFRPLIEWTSTNMCDGATIAIRLYRGAGVGGAQWVHQWTGGTTDDGDYTPSYDLYPGAPQLNGNIPFIEASNYHVKVYTIYCGGVYDFDEHYFTIEASPDPHSDTKSDSIVPISEEEIEVNHHSTNITRELDPENIGAITEGTIAGEMTSNHTVGLPDEIFPEFEEYIEWDKSTGHSDGNSESIEFTQNTGDHRFRLAYVNLELDYQHEDTYDVGRDPIVINWDASSPFPGRLRLYITPDGSWANRVLIASINTDTGVVDPDEDPSEERGEGTFSWSIPYGLPVINENLDPPVSTWKIIGNFYEDYEGTEIDYTDSFTIQRHGLIVYGFEDSIPAITEEEINVVHVHATLTAVYPAGIHQQHYHINGTNGMEYPAWNQYLNENTGGWEVTPNPGPLIFQWSSVGISNQVQLSFTDFFTIPSWWPPDFGNTLFWQSSLTDNDGSYEVTSSDWDMEALRNYQGNGFGGWQRGTLWYEDEDAWGVDGLDNQIYNYPGIDYDLRQILWSSMTWYISNPGLEGSPENQFGLEPLYIGWWEHRLDFEENIVAVSEETVEIFIRHNPQEEFSDSIHAITDVIDDDSIKVSTPNSEEYIEYTLYDDLAEPYVSQHHNPDALSDSIHEITDVKEEHSPSDVEENPTDSIVAVYESEIPIQVIHRPQPRAELLDNLNIVISEQNTADNPLNPISDSANVLMTDCGWEWTGALIDVESGDNTNGNYSMRVRFYNPNNNSAQAWTTFGGNSYIPESNFNLIVGKWYVGTIDVRHTGSGGNVKFGYGWSNISNTIDIIRSDQQEWRTLYFSFVWEESGTFDWNKIGVRIDNSSNLGSVKLDNFSLLPVEGEPVILDDIESYRNVHLSPSALTEDVSFTQPDLAILVRHMLHESATDTIASITEPVIDSLLKSMPRPVFSEDDVPISFSDEHDFYRNVHIEPDSLIDSPLIESLDFSVIRKNMPRPTFLEESPFEDILIRDFHDFYVSKRYEAEFDEDTEDESVYTWSEGIVVDRRNMPRPEFSDTLVTQYESPVPIRVRVSARYTRQFHEETYLTEGFFQNVSHLPPQVEFTDTISKNQWHKIEHRLQGKMGILLRENSLVNWGNPVYIESSTEDTFAFSDAIKVSSRNIIRINTKVDAIVTLDETIGGVEYEERLRDANIIHGIGGTISRTRPFYRYDTEEVMRTAYHVIGECPSGVLTVDPTTVNASYTDPTITGVFPDTCSCVMLKYTKKVGTTAVANLIIGSQYYLNLGNKEFGTIPVVNLDTSLIKLETTLDDADNKAFIHLIIIP